MKRFLRGLVVTTLFVGLSAGAWTADAATLSQNVYKPGVRHGDVQVIQEALKKDGDFHYHKTTTYYGAITKEAVKTFQRKYGLAVDGIVGKNTIAKMQALGLLEDTKIATSRGSSRRTGEYLDWWSSASKLVDRGDAAQIEDLETGKRFQIKRTSGTNHADVETLTKEDTEVLKNIWGGFSWTRRPVLVHKDGRVIAASMTAMPHAGVESKPAGETVSNRSGGYGTGYNFDTIKGNGMDGHIDLHFKNSLRHKDDKVDPNHQAAIKKAAGVK